MISLLIILITIINAQWLLLEEDAPPMITTESDARIPARKECGAWCINDDIYVYGGSSSSGGGGGGGGENKELIDFWKYETENRRWIWMQDPSLSQIQNMAYWSIQGEIYLFGRDTLWNYQPDTRIWSHLDVLGSPKGTREHMAFWSHKPTNRIFIYGGVDSNNTLLKDMWSFNIKTLEWKSITYSGNHPGKRKGANAILGKSEDTVYLFGGIDDKGLYPSDLHQLDITTMTWSISSSSMSPSGTGKGPEGRIQHTLFMSANQDKISVFGGKQGSKLYSDYWLYDPSIELWIKSDKSGGPSGRWGSCGCTDSRGDYYMFGGTFEDPQHFHNDLWKNGQISAKNIFQILDFKLDTVTLASLLAATMSTILVCVLFFALLCMCVKKCRKDRHLINSYKVSSIPLHNDI